MTRFEGESRPRPSHRADATCPAGPIVLLAATRYAADGAGPAVRARSVLIVPTSPITHPTG